MAGTTIILTVLFSIVAIALFVTLAALAWLLLKERTKQRRVDAIRANPETLQVRLRESVADEIAPRGRGAQAKADVKAAQAAGNWPLGTIRTSVDLSAD